MACAQEWMGALMGQPCLALHRGPPVFPVGGSFLYPLLRAWETLFQEGDHHTGHEPVQQHCGAALCPSGLGQLRWPSPSRPVSEPLARYTPCLFRAQTPSRVPASHPILPSFMSLVRKSPFWSQVCWCISVIPALKRLGRRITNSGGGTG